MSGLAPLVYTSGFGFIGFWYLGERERERVSQPASHQASEPTSCETVVLQHNIIVSLLLIIVLMFCALYS